MQNLSLNKGLIPESIVITKSIDRWYQEATVTTHSIKKLKDEEELKIAKGHKEFFSGVIGSVSETLNSEGRGFTLVSRTKNFSLENSSFSRDDIYWDDDPTLKEYLQILVSEVGTKILIDEAYTRKAITAPETNPGTGLKSAVLAGCRVVGADIWSEDGKTLKVGKYKPRGELKAALGKNIIEWETIENNFDLCRKYSLFGQDLDGDYLETVKTQVDVPFPNIFCTSIASDSTDKELKYRLNAEIKRRKTYSKTLYLTIKGWEACLLNRLKWQNLNYLVHSLRHTFSKEEGFRTQVTLFRELT